MALSKMCGGLGKQGAMQEKVSPHQASSPRGGASWHTPAAQEGQVSHSHIVLSAVPLYRAVLLSLPEAETLQYTSHVVVTPNHIIMFVATS